jgi:hypothetical protein
VILFSSQAPAYVSTKLRCPTLSASRPGQGSGIAWAGMVMIHRSSRAGESLCVRGGRSGQPESEPIDVDAGTLADGTASVSQVLSARPCPYNFALKLTNR